MVMEWERGRIFCTDKWGWRNLRDDCMGWVKFLSSRTFRCYKLESRFPLCSAAARTNSVASNWGCSCSGSPCINIGKRTVSAENQQNLTAGEWNKFPVVSAACGGQKSNSLCIRCHVRTSLCTGWPPPMRLFARACWRLQKCKTVPYYDLKVIIRGKHFLGWSRNWVLSEKNLWWQF